MAQSENRQNWIEWLTRVESLIALFRDNWKLLTCWLGGTGGFAFVIKHVKALAVNGWAEAVLLGVIASFWSTAVWVFLIWLRSPFKEGSKERPSRLLLIPAISVVALLGFAGAVAFFVFAPRLIANNDAKGKKSVASDVSLRFVDGRTSITWSEIGCTVFVFGEVSNAGEATNAKFTKVKLAFSRGDVFIGQIGQFPLGVEAHTLRFPDGAVTLKASDNLAEKMNHECPSKMPLTGYLIFVFRYVNPDQLEKDWTTFSGHTLEVEFEDGLGKVGSSSLALSQLIPYQSKQQFQIPQGIRSKQSQ